MSRERSEGQLLSRRRWLREQRARLLLSRRGRRRLHELQLCSWQHWRRFNSGRTVLALLLPPSLLPHLLLLLLQLGRRGFSMINILG